MIYIFWTAADREEARHLVEELLEQRLIACASLLPEVESIYRWEGKVESSQETKVLLKTRPDHFPAICAHIQSHGSYEVPEIASLRTEQVAAAYLEWLLGET